jgi:hypothetical protein
VHPLPHTFIRCLSVFCESPGRNSVGSTITLALRYILRRSDQLACLYVKLQPQSLHKSGHRLCSVRPRTSRSRNLACFATSTRLSGFIAAAAVLNIRMVPLSTLLPYPYRVRAGRDLESLHSLVWASFSPLLPLAYSRWPRSRFALSILRRASFVLYPLNMRSLRL